jgi:hypothetical protein
VLYWGFFGGAHRVRAALPLFLALCLSAFFWVPALLEKGLVQIEGAVFGYSYVGLWQLIPQISTFTEKQVTLSFQLGLFHILAFLSALALLRNRYSRFLMAALGLTIFLMTPYSDPLWRLLPLSEFVQFSWRLLALAALLSSIMGGLVVERLNLRGKTALVLCLLVVLSSYNFIGLRGAIDFDEGELSPQGVRDFNTGLTYRGEYLPRGAKMLPIKTRRVEAVEGPAVITAIKEECKSLEFEVTVPSDSTLRIETYYFPGWTAYVDGAKTEIQKDENGLLLLKVPPGRHSVLVRFEDTEIRRFANILSVVALFVLIGISVYPFLIQNPPGC